MKPLFKTALVISMAFLMATGIQAGQTYQEAIESYGVTIVWDDNNDTAQCSSGDKHAFFSLTEGTIGICNHGGDVESHLKHELIHVAQWCKGDRRYAVPLGIEVSTTHAVRVMRHYAVAHWSVEMEAFGLQDEPLDDVMGLVDLMCGE
jgi:hypothetical protein